VISWRGSDAFVISDVEYVCRPVQGRFSSTASRFCLLKARWQVDSYVQLLDEVAPRRMVEVGMYDGASMALTAELARPENLIGIDLRSSGSPALDEFISSHGLHDELHPHYGVDQADTAQLQAILAKDLGDHLLDLVVDDASHLFEATLRTFNYLFPRLRPGGTYVIEDWPTHRFEHDDQPLALLALELTLACSDAPQRIDGVRITKNDVLVTRGPAELSSDSFELRECLGPRARTFFAELRSQRP
jgi:hypothetical protein